jgi:hypothetical protein
MKLKDRFIEHVYCFMGSGMLTNTYDENVANYHAEKCEKIADDFSIEFSKWCFKNFDMTNTIEQLLEIYKKEKSL